MATQTEAILLGPVEEFPSGTRKIIQHGRISIGVFRVDDDFYALRNYCPHEGAELCKGPVTGTNIPTETSGELKWDCEGFILRCPWHAWEFDLRDGRSYTATKMRVKTYSVEVKDGEVFLIV